MTDNPIEPTVGRIVLYVLPVEWAGAPTKIRPAMIVDVVTPSVVSLQQFTNGVIDGCEVQGTVWRQNTHYNQPRDGHKPLPGTWHWMPYQFELELAKRRREAGDRVQAGRLTKIPTEKP